MIRLIVDKAIPYLDAVLPRYFDVLFLPAAQITRNAIRDFGADALIIRTVTRCNEQLLSGTKVRFIATATAGSDHIDRDYCRAEGICVADAAGCNALAVAQWLFAALARRAVRAQRPLTEERIGIVGVGHVGSAVAQQARIIGCKTLLCDPPLERQNSKLSFNSLDTLAQNCTLLTFHVPLTRDGLYPTFHLINRELIQKLSSETALVNASRGAVACTEELIEARKSGAVGDLLIDCWEGEPNINTELLALAHTATPHIAGYSAESKARSSRCAVAAVANFFGIDALHTDLLNEIAPPAPENNYIDASDFGDYTLEKTLLATVSITQTEQKLRSESAYFEQLRTTYPYHREPSAWIVQHATPRYREQLSALGFRLAKSKT